MRTLFVVFITLLTVNGCSMIPFMGDDSAPETQAKTPSPTSPDNADKTYETLVSQLRAHPDQISRSTITHLREAFTHTSDNALRRQLSADQLPKVVAALNKQDWQTCLTASQTLLSHNYVSLMGHYAAMTCNQHLARPDQADIHQRVLENTAAAIVHGRDGSEPAQAFPMLSQQEEDTFLLFRQMKPLERKTFKLNKHFYDEVKVQIKGQSAPKTYYFDVSAFVSDAHQ